ncbi:MAG: hypothetical protein WDN29_01645 [Methylovirgula sp.]
MVALPVLTVVGILAATIVFAVVLDLVKVPVFRRLGLPEISVRNRRKRYKIRSNEFRVRKGKKVDLKKCPTVDPVYESKEQYEEILRRCYATFAAAGGYQSMRYNIAIGYDTAGLFFVSSSNVPSLKIRARSFKEIVEKAHHSFPSSSS